MNKIEFPTCCAVFSVVCLARDFGELSLFGRSTAKRKTRPNGKGQNLDLGSEFCPLQRPNTDFWSACSSKRINPPKKPCCHDSFIKAKQICSSSPVSSLATQFHQTAFPKKHLIRTSFALGNHPSWKALKENIKRARWENFFFYFIKSRVK